jgi:hypothetical protein
MGGSRSSRFGPLIQSRASASTTTAGFEMIDASRGAGADCSPVRDVCELGYGMQPDVVARPATISPSTTAARIDEAPQVQGGVPPRFAPGAAEVKAITAMSAMSRQATRRSRWPQRLTAIRMATAGSKRHGPLDSSSTTTSPTTDGCWTGVDYGSRRSRVGHHCY